VELTKNLTREFWEEEAGGWKSDMGKSACSLFFGT
jgi:hypothetical protein